MYIPDVQVFLLAVCMPRTLEGASIANLWKVLGWTGDVTKLLCLCGLSFACVLINVMCGVEYMGVCI